jgi:glutamate synthase domain-containing protein 3
VVLGDVGVNLGAGMTGGVVYVLGDEGTVKQRVNADHVQCTRPLDDDWANARRLIAEHAWLTGSATAWAILSSWDACRARLHKIVPMSSEIEVARSRSRQIYVPPSTSSGSSASILSA